ncbi:lipase 3-like isoform X1 [Photinus pyralis]|uniref:lipase 3-like isoform X1 n=1 Tax=Photinus pyralis TaxID=7054 RepID=UPI001267353D|nr:lipase 3-like isoform X1 [Photinus pyralis]
MLATSFASQTDIVSDVAEFVRSGGYPFENISVVTEDGYLLDLFRIEHGLNVTTGKRPAVLVGHGLFGSSRDYLVMGPKRGLAYLLADRGYDVWLVNGRGTSYSRKHLALNPDVDPEFWYFSWHEVGVYDLPAIIDTIKSVTKQKRIGYIGLSMATTASYVLGAERSEYNNDLSVIISLAPVAFMRHINNPMLLFSSRFEQLLNVAGGMLNMYEIPPKRMQRLVTAMTSSMCHTSSIFVDACAAMLFFVGGHSPTQLDKEDLVTIMKSISPVSLRQILHFAQVINSGEFVQYNHGRSKNLQKYKNAMPPAYDLNKITAPVALFYSDGDLLSRPKDVELLCRKLPRCVVKHRVKLDSFNHFDFLFAIDVVELLYDDVIRVLDSYSDFV